MTPEKQLKLQYLLQYICLGLGDVLSFGSSLEKTALQNPQARVFEPGRCLEVHGIFGASTLRGSSCQSIVDL